MLRLAGPVTALRAPEHGPFRALRAAPGAVRAALGTAPVLAYVTRRPLGQRQIGQLRHLAGRLRARIILLPLVVGPAALVTRPEALVRAVRAAAAQLPEGTLVVPSRFPRAVIPPRNCAPAPSSRPPTGRPTCWRIRVAPGGEAALVLTSDLVLTGLSLTFPRSA